MKCDMCSTKLKAVNTGSSQESGLYEDALTLIVEGGYGMYYDTLESQMANQRYEYTICKKCADELFEKLHVNPDDL